METFEVGVKRYWREVLKRFVLEYACLLMSAGLYVLSSIKSFKIEWWFYAVMGYEAIKFTIIDVFILKEFEWLYRISIYDNTVELRYRRFNTIIIEFISFNNLKLVYRNKRFEGYFYTGIHRYGESRIGTRNILYEPVWTRDTQKEIMKCLASHGVIVEQHFFPENYV